MRVAELADLISTFQHHHPRVAIELHDGKVDTLQEKLECGDIDVALTVLSLRRIAHPSSRDESQTSTILFQQPLLLAVSTSHLFAQRASIRLAELDGQPIIDRVNCEFFQQECEILSAANVHPNVVYRASHEEWVIALIRAGLGASIMPHWRKLTGITYIPISDLDFQRVIGLKWRLHSDLELVEQFCRFATSHRWDSADMG